MMIGERYSFDGRRTNERRTTRLGGPDVVREQGIHFLRRQSRSCESDACAHSEPSKRGKATKKHIRTSSTPIAGAAAHAS